MYDERERDDHDPRDGMMHDLDLASPRLANQRTPNVLRPALAVRTARSGRVLPRSSRSSAQKWLTRWRLSGNPSINFSHSAMRFQLVNLWSTNLRSMIQAEVVHHSLAKILSQATVDLSEVGFRNGDPYRFAAGVAIRRSSSKKLRMKTSRSCGRSIEPSSGATATRSPSGCRSNERCPVCGPM